MTDATDNPDDAVQPVVETIRLDQFLKLAGVADTGGQAKFLIQAGEVLVNGAVETRRRCQLRPGDEVQYGEDVMIVAADDDEEESAAFS